MEPITPAVFKKAPHILSLMLLSAFAIMGAIVLTPSLPKISSYFEVSPGTAQLTVTLFLLGYAGGQLIYGPIANRFGRKTALHVGIVIATIGSIFSILSAPFESFGILLWGRLLEALGSSAGLVVSYTIINDFYVAERRKIMATIMLAFAIVPGVAVLVGGFIAQYLSWHCCFYFLLVYGLFLIIPVIQLPETLIEKDVLALKFKKMIKSYWSESTNLRLIGFSASAGLSSGCVYVFGAEGPFIGIHLLKVDPAYYGMLGLIPYLGTFLGSLVLMKWCQIEPMRLLKGAFLCELIAALAMFFSFLFGWVSLLSLLSPMVLLCFGHPVLAATGISMSMMESKDKANGSAVMNFTMMTVAMLITLILGILHISSPLILPILFFLSLFLMVAIAFSCGLFRMNQKA